ncbi:MAG: hypothetical protein JWQ38_658, partial [Flavipsychrobacter sp.]|nr:hypothetical protein [Flavipsychrobacter sp.]
HRLMNILATIKEKILEYLDVHIKLLKLNFIGQTSKVVSYFLFAFICLFIVFAIVLFLGFGLTETFMALGLSKLASFFVTIGVYILMLTIVISCRRGITRFFASGIISAMSSDEDKKKDKEQ